MRKFLLLITFFSTIAFADTISELNKEFARRDNIKLTGPQGSLINYLRAVKFPLETITVLDVRDDADQTFFFKDRYDMICYGKMILQNLRCKNALGISGLEFSSETLPTPVVSPTSSDLEQDFAARDSIVPSSSSKRVLTFLKTIKYSAETIVELEVLGDLSESFFIRDRNDIVCFGSVIDQMLRCKNEIGITGVTFTGDSD